MIESQEPALVEALVPESAVEAFDVSTLNRFPWIYEVHPYPLGLTPGQKGHGSKLRAVVHNDHLREAASICNGFQHMHPIPSRL